MIFRIALSITLVKLQPRRRKAEGGNIPSFKLMPVSIWR